jgi:hypothetical protein
VRPRAPFESIVRDRDVESVAAQVSWSLDRGSLTSTR